MKPRISWWHGAPLFVLAAALVAVLAPTFAPSSTDDEEFRVSWETGTTNYESWAQLERQIDGRWQPVQSVSTSPRQWSIAPQEKLRLAYCLAGICSYKPLRKERPLSLRLYSQERLVSCGGDSWWTCPPDWPKETHFEASSWRELSQPPALGRWRSVGLEIDLATLGRRISPVGGLLLETGSVDILYRLSSASDLATALEVWARRTAPWAEVAQLIWWVRHADGSVDSGIARDDNEIATRGEFQNFDRTLRLWGAGEPPDPAALRDLLTGPAAKVGEPEIRRALTTARFEGDGAGIVLFRTEGEAATDPTPTPLPNSDPVPPPTTTTPVDSSGNPPPSSTGGTPGNSGGTDTTTPPPPTPPPPLPPPPTPPPPTPTLPAAVPSPRLIRVDTLRHSKAVNAVAFSQDGQALASASNDSTIKIWHSRDGSVDILDLQRPVNAVAFAKNGSLASGGNRNTLYIWNLTTGTRRRLRGHPSRWDIHAVAFNADGSVLASAANDGRIKLWDPRTEEEITTLEGHLKPVTALDFSPLGLLASGDTGGTLMVWNPATARLQRSRQLEFIYTLRFSPSTALLAVGGEMQRVNLFEPLELVLEAQTERLGTSSEALAFSSNPEVMAVGTALGTVVFAELNGKPLAARWTDSNEPVEEIHTRPVTGVAISPDGRLLATCSEDRTVKIWQLSGIRQDSP